MTSDTRPVPRDGRLISLILASKGIEDADERVIHQMLDFAHREQNGCYTADVLQSAQSLADHAGRAGPSRIEKEDVELAIQFRKRYEFFEPPPRDYLASLAHDLNSQPLPILPETFDVLRLPPPHQRLGEVDFNIVPNEELTLESEDEGDDDSSDSEDQEEDAVKTEDGVNGERASANPEADPDDGDDDMEEVGVSDQAPAQSRQVEEDYDE
ncbi:transcription initiation factor IID, 31kD subunit-domain-containing protein [Kockovaella imperatae]|uniref:Transcription initiation factor IID, 31kD subunit-domain-containing protein n=1 Tax=Kockovaella imperatae TaxID=4999 RepID=A0A1Y1U9Q0_9TREE|nr:transcription initiation factor IID, 31kD subunit-domain-containing protein [Kockovaella imperatae]ORX34761.1 transcription initiation factor IID, 31kD subunit-domain-containing protein [Kockovaella imperatae]